VLGLLNALVRPLLVVLTLPITIITVGLFIVVINAMLFSLAASFVDGFAVHGFLSALIGSILVSVVSTVGNRFIS
jgi:putative membrane protein